MKPETLKLIRDGDGPKGDVLGPARIAGIMAAKKHGRADPALPSDCRSSYVGVEFTLDEARSAIIATRRSAHHRQDRRGDGSADRGLGCATDDLRHGQGGRPRMAIGDIRLVEKTGGTRGDYRA